MFTVSAFGYELMNFKRKKHSKKKLKYAIHTSRKYYIRLKYFALEPRTSIFSLSDARTTLRNTHISSNYCSYLYSWNFKPVIGWKMYKRSKFCLTKLGAPGGRPKTFSTPCWLIIFEYMYKTKNARLGIHILDNIWMRHNAICST